MPNTRAWRINAGVTYPHAYRRPPYPALPQPTVGSDRIASRIIEPPAEEVIPPSGPSMPPVTTGLDAYFDAYGITGLIDGEAVAQWNDSSASAAHATQADSTKRPHLAVTSGRPAVRFGGGTYLSAPVETGGATQTVILVVRPRAQAYGRIWCGGTGGFGVSTIDDGRMYSLRVNLDNLQIASAASGYTVGTVDLWTTGYNATGGTGWRKNSVAAALDASNSNALTATSTVIIGTAFNGATPDAFPFNGDVLAILHYNVVLTATETTDVEAWARTRYGTPALPTTQVTSTRSTAWDVNATTSSSRATTWDVETTTSSTRPTTWDVRTATTASRATSWDVLSQVNSQRSTTWRVRAAVTSARTTTWDVPTAVTTTRQATWDLRTSPTATRSASWDTLARIERALATSWDVRTQATSQRSTTWNVDGNLGSVTANRATSWHVRATATGTRATTWDTNALATNARTTTWGVRADVARTSATTWRTLAPAAGVRATTWDTLGLVTASRDTTWEVVALATNFEGRILAVRLSVPTAGGSLTTTSAAGRIATTAASGELDTTATSGRLAIRQATGVLT